MIATTTVTLVGGLNLAQALPQGLAIWFYLLGIAFFLLLNAFFVAAEFTIVRLHPGLIESRAKELNRHPGKAALLARNVKGYLSANQLGITFSSLALGFLGEPFTRALILPLTDPLQISAGWAYTAALVLSYAVFTFLHVVLGELIPRAIGSRHAVATAFIIAAPLHAFYCGFEWVIRLQTNAAEFLLRTVLRQDPSTGATVGHSAEELALFVAQSGRSKDITETERKILTNTLKMNDLWVRDVMTPRSDVVVLDADQPFEKTLEVALRSKHTRFPLVKGHIDQSIGLIHIKDLFKLVTEPDPDLMRIKRDLKVVADIMPLDSLLEFFLREHAHLAIAVDEFGTPVGAVFLDNVMEALVGDIQDEFDNESSGFIRINATEFVVEGGLTLNELGEIEKDLDLDSEEITTVGGYVTQQLGRFPEVGEILEIQGHEAKVTSIDGRKVGQVHFRRLAVGEHLEEDVLAAESAS